MPILIDRFKRPRTLAVILIVFILTGLHYIGVLKPIEGVVTTVIKPFQLAATGVTNAVERISAPFSSVIALQENNRALQSEKNNLLLQVTALQQQLNLQETLTAQFSYLRERSFTFVPAKIIGATADPTFASLIVNIGDSQGVAVGQAVVVDNGVLIGTVRSVEAQHAEILLIGDKRSVIDASVSNEDQTPGVISGQFSTNLYMDLIPQGKRIAPNAVVVTRSSDQLPDGLVIGKVVEVSDNPGQLFQTALVAPAASVEDATIVSIITGQQ